MPIESLTRSDVPNSLPYEAPSMHNAKEARYSVSSSGRTAVWPSKRASERTSLAREPVAAYPQMFRSLLTTADTSASERARAAPAAGERGIRRLKRQIQLTWRRPILTRESFCSLFRFCLQTADILSLETGSRAWLVLWPWLERHRCIGLRSVWRKIVCCLQELPRDKRLRRLKSGRVIFRLPCCINV